MKRMPRRWVHGLTALWMGLWGVTNGEAREMKQEIATFAGGCFWCVEHLFDGVDGVISTTSGYIGGEKDNPTYEEVSAGKTGHAEAVQVVFDPEKVDYAALLRLFWRNIDPTTPNRQFCDVGSQYRSAIFYHDEGQKRLALASKADAEAKKPFPEPLVTPIVPASPFYPAEGYHQDYHVKNPVRYRYYRLNCGRDQRLRELWGDPPAGEKPAAAH
ncbi:MAG: peptide-methionine (S)-S-oxide reductase MsrA [Magnetococcales bacterium]|nr:peptide-methionine (S)-S-oxide reductase MsrA [Magnetococcales bacterium]